MTRYLLGRALLVLLAAALVGAFVIGGPILGASLTTQSMGASAAQNTAAVATGGTTGTPATATISPTATLSPTTTPSSTATASLTPTSTRTPTPTALPTLAASPTLAPSPQPVVEPALLLQALSGSEVFSDTVQSAVTITQPVNLPLTFIVTDTAAVAKAQGLTAASPVQVMWTIEYDDGSGFKPLTTLSHQTVNGADILENVFTMVGTYRVTAEAAGKKVLTIVEVQKAAEQGAAGGVQYLSTTGDRPGLIAMDASGKALQTKFGIAGRNPGIAPDWFIVVCSVNNVCPPQPLMAIKPVSDTAQLKLMSADPGKLTGEGFNAFELVATDDFARLAEKPWIVLVGNGELTLDNGVDKACYKLNTSGVIVDVTEPVSMTTNGTFMALAVDGADNRTGVAWPEAEPTNAKCGTADLASTGETLFPGNETGWSVADKAGIEYTKAYSQSLGVDVGYVPQWSANTRRSSNWGLAIDGLSTDGGFSLWEAIAFASRGTTTFTATGTVATLDVYGKNAKPALAFAGSSGSRARVTDIKTGAVVEFKLNIGSALIALDPGQTVKVELFGDAFVTHGDMSHTMKAGADLRWPHSMDGIAPQNVIMSVAGGGR